MTIASSLRIGGAPALILSALILVTIVFQLQSAFVLQNADLSLILNVVFLTGTSLVVTVISAKSYLKNGALNILILGSALLISGLVALIAGMAGFISANYNNIIYNTGICVSAGLQFISAIVTVPGSAVVQTDHLKRKSVMAVCFIASVTFVAALTALTLAGFIPAFLINSVPTLLRQIVTGIAVLFFSLSCIIFGWQYARTKSNVLFWYSLALGMFAIGLFSAFGVHQTGDILTWLAKLSVFAGGFYFLASVLAVRKQANYANTTIAGRWAEVFRTDPKQFTALFSNLLNGFTYNKIITDKQGQPINYEFLDVNHAFEKMMGLKKDKIIGKKVTDVILGAEKDWINTYSKVVTTGEPAVFESYSNQLNKWFNISAYNSPQKGYFVALYEDITERKKAEEALKESEELFSKAFQSNPSVLTITRVSDNIMTNVNEAFVRLFGFSKEEAVGHTSKELKLFPDYNDRQKIINEISKEGSIRNIELKVQTKDAKILNTLASVEVINIHGAKHLLVALLDITGQKILQEKIDAYTRNLEKIVEDRTKALKDAERLAAIGATAGMVGHDIRNPLQAITGDLYLLNEELKTTPKSTSRKAMEENIQEIEKNIIYINKIVSDLQDYTKPLKPKIEEVNLKDLINSTLTVVNVPEDIETAVNVRSNLSLKVDAAYLKRALTNLTINAVQAMPNGGKLTIKAASNKETAIISVEDTGVGIPEEVKPNLFKPLYTTKSKGQGLGLAVVKRFVDGLNGKISFESTEGLGTKFIIELPVDAKLSKPIE